MELRPTEVHELATPDGATLRLSRVRGGKRGPVVLVHGAGVHSGMFAVPSLEESFALHLAKREFDVWLLDWRASTCLPLTQFTLDEAAEHDFPTAIRKIREVTGSATVQAVVHCAGSIAFFMSLASGRLGDVRSVVASQVALHYETANVSAAKSLLHVPDVIAAAGIDYLTPTEHAAEPLLQAALGRVCDLVHHECASTVCHRITFLYGHLYRHDKLDRVTHDEQLPKQFGRCNITAFRHLAQLVRRGTAAKFDYGEPHNLARYGDETPPTYLHPDPLRIPITFLSGSRNECFLPKSTERTYEWLCDVHGAARYERHVVPEYGHIDAFFGVDARREVYPYFVKALEATA